MSASPDAPINSTERYTKRSWKDRIDVRTLTMVAVLFLLWIVFTGLTSEWFTNFRGSFITPRNLSNLIRAMAIVGVLGCGMVLVIVTGGIDLSVGTMAGFIGCVAAALQVWYDLPTGWVFVITILIGMAAGLVQGAIIAYAGIAAFIVTLGGQLMFRGGVLFITKGATIAPLQSSFKFIASKYIGTGWTWAFAVAAVVLLLLSELRRREARKRYNTLDESGAFMIARWLMYAIVILVAAAVLNSYRGLPVQVFIMLALMLIFTVIADKTTFGRKVYAIGGNIAAARYSGINVKKCLTIVYVLNGFMAAVAGLILTARLDASPTQAPNMSLELDAIAAAVIGGTSMTGGVGKVAGAILGALIMATIDNGMSLMNLMPAWQFLVKGMILVAAVWFDMQSQKKKRAV